MYIILVYDVSVERVGKVCNYLRRFLPRVQNSVFEGEITPAQFAKMKSGLDKILDTDEDSVLIWVLRDAKWAEREVIGLERNPITNIL